MSRYSDAEREKAYQRSRNGGKTTVKAHPRETESGKVTRVKRHQRPIKGAKQKRSRRPKSQQQRASRRAQQRYLSPKKATRTLRNANRYRRRGDMRMAAGLACAAGAQFLLIIFVQVSVLLLIGLGICLGALAYMLKQATK